MAWTVAQTQQSYHSWLQNAQMLWWCHDYIKVTGTTGNGDPLRLLDRNVDWESIAQKAQDLNVAGVSCMALSSWGFRYYTSGLNISPYSNGGFTYPRYGNNYDITNTALSSRNIRIDHLARFIKAFRSRGIKVGFYCNLAHQESVYSYTAGTGTGPRDCFFDYLIKEIKWLRGIFQPDYFLFDNLANDTFTATQKDAIYQAARGIDGLTYVMMNLWQGVIDFPCDFKITEFHGLPGSEGYWNPETTFSSVEYYIPSIFAHSGVYSTSGEGGAGAKTVRWGFWDEPVTGTWNLIEPQSHFNFWWSYAQTRGVPFMSNMPIWQGDVHPTYLDRLENLTIV